MPLEENGIQLPTGARWSVPLKIYSFEMGSKDRKQKILTTSYLCMVPFHSGSSPESLLSPLSSPCLWVYPVYLLSFTLYPNKMFHKLSPWLLPYNSYICSWYICKKTFQMLWKNMTKRVLHPFEPRPDTTFFMLVLYFLLSPSLRPPATSASLFWCSSPGNGASHFHPESTLRLLSLPDPLSLSHLCSSSSLNFPRRSLSSTL